jgi:hypothetical protein
MDFARVVVADMHQIEAQA